MTTIRRSRKMVEIMDESEADVARFLLDISKLKNQLAFVEGKVSSSVEKFAPAEVKLSEAAEKFAAAEVEHEKKLSEAAEKFAATEVEHEKK